MGLSNEKFAQIRRIYDERRVRGQQLQQAHLREAETAAPRLKEIRDEIASISIEQTLRRLNGAGGDASVFRRQLAVLHDEKIRILAKMGYPADYLEPVYECPDCRDTGYIGSEKCHCMKQLCIDLLYEQSHIRSQLETECFETFRLDYYDRSRVHDFYRCTSYDAAKRALEACRRFSERFGTDRGNILLTGDVGTGKTFLTHCIAKAVLDQGYSVLYFSAGELIGHLSDIAFRREDADPEEYDQILHCDLLIIDDLGTEMANSFTVQQLFFLLNERMIRGASVVISTNLSMEEIEDRYSQRTASRLSGSCLILNMFGEDIRYRKRILSLTKGTQGLTGCVTGSP